MHLQVISFDGPRSEDVVAASHRAGRERIEPLIESDPELRSRLLGGVRGLGPDGAECVLVLAEDDAALDALQHLIMTSELLAGEDPALLTGPTRINRYAVSDSFGRLAEMLAGAGQ